MKRRPKVPSVGADEDAATIFRAAKKNIQPANQISLNTSEKNEEAAKGTFGRR